MKDPRFSTHNLQQTNTELFLAQDPHLKRLNQQIFIHHSSLLNELPIDKPGIYMVGGGRQVGKTTVLKQWMARLISTGVEGTLIQFFTGELIDDHHMLLNHLQAFLTSVQNDKIKYIIVDEVTYIKDWTKAIKYAADAGLMESTVLILTGSDLGFLREGLILLPGRRGRAEKVDFHLHPLSFRDFVLLKQKTDFDCFDCNDPRTQKLLDLEFENYLKHGGFLTAINDLAKFNRVENSTFRIYSDWIRGDVIKRNKSEGYLREVLSAILKYTGSQVSWNSLSKSLSIDHPQTVAEYVELLSRMDCLFVQSALLEDKLTAAPKKAKKIAILDPFIHHSIYYYLKSGLSSDQANHFYESQIVPQLLDSEKTSSLVESVVVSHYRRLAPTYYIKAEGEVDLAVVTHGKFKPIEVKWMNQLRTKDLKQILKYKNSLILSKSAAMKVEGVTVEHLPSHLFNLELGS